jgi:glycosyltransferase involved in cell wall biosynthesis
VVKALLTGRPLDSSFNVMLHQLAIDRDLSSDVIFLYYYETILEILSAVDVFLLLSQREGFRRSPLGAMSVGLSVLAAKIGETEEAVIDGENAILVDFNDFEKVASCIVKLSEDES